LYTKHLLVLIFLLSIYPLPSSSQVIDSLSNLLIKTEIKQHQVDLWNKISAEQQPIGGRKAAENALNLAKQIKYPKGEADANFYLGNYYYLKEDKALTKKFMKRAVAIYDSLGLEEEVVETLNFLGEVFFFEEKYSLALKHLQDAENIATKINDKKLLAFIYETKSFIYSDGLEDKELGKSYLLKSNKIFKEIETPKYLVNNYLRLASFYSENNKIDSALFFIEKGEAKLPLIKHSSLKSYLQHNLTGVKGTCYAITGKLDTAKLFIEESIAFFKANENWYSVAWAYTDLSIVAFKKGNFKEAISYAKKSIELDVTAFSLKDNTKLIRDAYKHINQDSFLVYNEKFIAIIDDTKSILHANEIQEVIRKEELHKKNKELINEKNSSKNIIIGILFLSFAYGLSLLFYYKNPKRKKVRSNVKETKKPDLDAPNKEIEAQIDLLRQKVHTIERSLLSKEIDLERQRSSLDNTTQHLKEIVAKDNPEELKRSIQKLSNQLEYNQNSKDHLDSFSQQFEQIHPNFFNRLSTHSPNLSTREKRLCAYGRLGMTNQEVAQILGIATSSVGKARHRLKKKMNLDKNQDLNQFLSTL